LAKIRRIFGCGAGYQDWLASHSAGRRVNELKTSLEFDHCMSEGCGVSLWYGGMLGAWNNAERIVDELTT
jgi:hypothetical protein